MNPRKALITGSSSGLGLSLVDALHEKGYEIYGISRSTTPRPIHYTTLDFSHYEDLGKILKELSGDTIFDYVVLNAGTLNPIEKATEITTEDFLQSIHINVVSAKKILDFLLKNKKVKNVIAISSGAALKPYDGWISYCVSKAALKQLIACYAVEHPDIHFLSLAPGIIKTKMQDYILTKDSTRFRSLEKFHSLYETLPSPDDVAHKIVANLSFLASRESGSFFDLREIECK